MQLKKPASALRQQLMAASCALLGAAAAQAGDAAASAPATPVPATALDAGSDGATSQGDWKLDSALAYYHEGAGRVSAIEPMVNLSRDDGAGNAVRYSLTYDSLSGASPNGALKSSSVQTFASPSGNSLSSLPQTYTTASGQTSVISAALYKVAAGALPMDPNYKDQRLAFGAAWQAPLAPLLRASYGADVSWEHDFLSLSGNGGLARDFNQKNTTLSAGLSEELDSVKPIGGAPLAGTDYALFQKAGSRSKSGTGLQLGVTQVMSPAWITQLNLNADRFRGYLNDPYKVVSLLDVSGNTTGYLYEKRPEERQRRSIYLENRLGSTRASAALSLRYMGDDWGVHSDTAQLRVRWWNGEHDRYLEPTVRWYRQTAASFYTPWLDNTVAPYPTAMSADERLGAFTADTIGLKYAVRQLAHEEEPASEFSVRLEFYRQAANHRRAAPALLQGLDLYPSLSAVTLQVGWSFGG
jgi:hypothetical protein